MSYHLFNTLKFSHSKPHNQIRTTRKTTTSHKRPWPLFALMFVQFFIVFYLMRPLDADCMFCLFIVCTTLLRVYEAFSVTTLTYFLHVYVSQKLPAINYPVSKSRCVGKSSWKRLSKRPLSLRLTGGLTLRKPIQSGLGCLLSAFDLTMNSKNRLTAYKETTQTENLKHN